jgi:hypothetical protein
MTAEPAFRRRPTFIRVTVELPADLIKEAELAVEGGGQAHCFRCLIELSLMSHLRLGRCDKTGLLTCAGDSCQFYRGRECKP